MTGWDAVARGVVRGDRPWSDLRRAGLQVARTGDRWTLGPHEHAPVSVSRADVEAGAATYAVAPDERREWASLILAADFFDVTDDRALETLWRAAFTA